MSQQYKSDRRGSEVLGSQKKELELTSDRRVFAEDTNVHNKSQRVNKQPEHDEYEQFRTSMNVNQFIKPDGDYSDLPPSINEQTDGTFKRSVAGDAQESRESEDQL